MPLIDVANDLRGEYGDVSTVSVGESLKPAQPPDLLRRLHHHHPPGLDVVPGLAAETVRARTRQTRLMSG